MRRLITIIAIVLTTTMSAQQGSTLQLGSGKATNINHKNGEISNDVLFSAGIQMDLFKSNFTLGPEVRVFVTEREFIPNVVVGSITGYDNGKWRLLTGVNFLSSIDANVNMPEMRVYRGIHSAELGYKSFFIRTDYFTNLKTYYYSYGVQVGFNIKF